jgi:hypothetical protein
VVYVMFFAIGMVSLLFVLGPDLIKFLNRLKNYLFGHFNDKGPVPWTVNSEIFPLKIRSLGNSIATMVNWSANLIVSVTFLSYASLVTPVRKIRRIKCNNTFLFEN